MKKIIYTLMLSILIMNSAFGQFIYSFSTSTVTYASLTSATDVFTTSNNNSITGNISIGFPFQFGCNTYTDMQICTEGWLGLGGGMVSNSANNLTGSTQRPIIAPLWDNMRVSGDATARIRYRLTGTAPNRVMTIEWYRMRWSETAGSGTNRMISFEVLLYETSNNIEFRYQQESTAQSGTSGSIGIAGPSSGEFYSISNAGAVSTITEFNVTNRPATNTSYFFTNTSTNCSGTPAVGLASSDVSSTSCGSTLVNFNLAGVTGCGITYQWQSSPDNTTWTNISGANSINYSTNVTVLTYFRCIVTCTNSGLSSTSNVVTITSTASAPANDLPCNAIDLTLNAPSSGNNICSSNSSEPATGSCWTGGNYNTVWYSLVAPPSGSLKIKTIIPSGGTILQRTQIALYSGACGSLTEIACNQNAPSCGGYAQSNSQITVTGLTPGVTYYISVDGLNSLVGNFSILAIDGNLDFPYVQGQDCPTSFTVCNPTTTIGNPGYQAIGGSCDQTGAGNCTNGEANSIWYIINIDPLLVGTTVLTFDIVPNDYGNPNPITGLANPGYSAPPDETDYDFVLWKVSGSGATNCAGILGGAAPAACNFSNLGTTGCSTSGNSPGAYPGFNGAYEVGPTVSAGESYVLVVQNYANSTSGFTLQIPLSSPVVYTPPTTVYWSGGGFDTDFTDPLNWGGCNAPACGISAVITPSSANQPILTSGSYYVNDLTINSGATLTLENGSLLRVCGNFTNNGSLICDPGSTIRFEGTGNQAITGAFENADAFGNFHVLKVSGVVNLMNNIDVKSNFFTQSATSIINTNGMRIRVGGNFGINSGNTTFTNTGTTGELIFYGSNNQTYNEGSLQLDLNIVTMNKTSGVLTTVSNMFLKPTTGRLNLNSGVIQTNGLHLQVNNSNPTAVTAGNATSYVNGNLWRAISGTGSYDFPVGTATLYERANVNFTSATSIPQLRCRFDPWAGSPNTLGLPDCFGTATYNIPSQNMGIWTITATSSPTTGVYDITLYSTGATNTAGAVGWTVEKAVNSVSPWGLNGTCAFSTVSVIRRTGLSGFSVFGVAQSTTPLPVELMNFQGYRKEDFNYLEWTTASEINSDYFALERSRNGKDFETIEVIKAQGNSTIPVNYSTTDLGQFNSINYYRLKVVDLDGSADFSKVISISSEISSELKIKSVYPNPGQTDLNFNYSVSRETDLRIQLVDNAGRVMWQDGATVDGNGVYTINTIEYAKGFYLLQISSDDGFQEVFRWVKN